MKYLLDTCVISELTRNRPNAAVIDWLCRQDSETLYLSSKNPRLIVSRRGAERRRAQRKFRNPTEKKNMTRRISEIYFTQLVKTNTCSSNGITSANSASPRLCVRYNMEW